MKKSIFDQLDEIDQKILTILMQEGRTPYADIGKILHVSPGTVHVRIKKLTELGIVTGNQMVVDYKLLGYDICSFLGIYLEKSSLYDQVSNELKKIPEVVSAHYTTGNYSIFAKLICRDTQHLRDTLSNKIQSIQGIQRTETFISLDETIERPLKLINIE